MFQYSHEKLYNFLSNWSQWPLVHIELLAFTVRTLWADDTISRILQVKDPMYALIYDRQTIARL